MAYKMSKGLEIKDRSAYARLCPSLLMLWTILPRPHPPPLANDVSMLPRFWRLIPFKQCFIGEEAVRMCVGSVHCGRRPRTSGRGQQRGKSGEHGLQGMSPAKDERRHRVAAIRCEADAYCGAVTGEMAREGGLCRRRQ